MTFDKDEYRRRRKAGKRGQGDIPEGKFTPHFGANRASYRQKLRARYYENEDDTAGKVFTAKGVKPNKQKKEKFSLTLDPTLSNKQRLHIREARREMIREDERKARNDKDQSSLQA